MSKTLIKRRCMQLLKTNTYENPLDCDDETFVLDLLSRHPEFEVRTGGRENVCAITTGLADYGTVCFYVWRCSDPRPLVKVSYITSLSEMTVKEAQDFWAEDHNCKEEKGNG